LSPPADLGAVFAAIIARIHVGIVCVDASFGVLQWNEFMELHSGLRAVDVVGRSLFDSVPDLPRKWLEHKIRGVFLLKNFAFTSWRQRPYLMRFPHNRPVTGGIDHMAQDVTFMPIKGDGGEVVAVCVMLFDATDACIAQRQADERNRDMRLVLDNVEQGLLTIDLAGRLAQERSAAVDRWFGAYAGQPSFVEHLGAVDGAFAEAFEVGYSALLEGVLPRDLCLQQLPSRLRAGPRELECTYAPILDRAELGGLLIVVDDVTERLRGAREGAEQRDLLALFQWSMRDRGGCQGMVDEATHLLDQLAGGGLDTSTQKRLLHTLKGNAGVAGMVLFASLCHAAEEELIEQGALPEATLSDLRGRWRVATEALGASGRSAVDISSGDVDALSRRIREGASPAELLDRLASWQNEPVERPLVRLAQHARALAKRIGKGDITVDVEAVALRLDPRRWSALWAVLVHVVQNAVDHGLESPPEREAAGKLGPARLALTATASPAELVLEVRDDGRGIDWAAVGRLAAARGLPGDGEHELLRALLSPDFSTREQATETSGRGVGLSAVDERVREMGGAIAIESRAGEGTCWRFSFPLPMPAA
jgi:two-component system chemotaxis sensor kinase CheA